MARHGLIIAIDGPSGAGKGTVARTIARRLSYRHVDTGAMYRAVAWKAREEGIDLADEPRVADVAARAALSVDADTIVIDGHDVTTAIRTPAMDQAAMTVARLPAVRAALVGRQRAIGAEGAVVMEGRDIGSVVFPEADVKVYFDASPDERARRRAHDPAHAAAQQIGAGGVAHALESRDHSDRTRAASPLRIAEDAVYIDTTSLGIDAVVARVLSIVDAALSHSQGA